MSRKLIKQKRKMERINRKKTMMKKERRARAVSYLVGIVYLQRISIISSDRMIL